jgi:hypothetical protein
MDDDPDFGGNSVEVFPLIVLSRIFPARPSSIPEIREFVRGALAESPMDAEDAREVDRAVSRALLDAAGPEGRIQVSFRVFPDHMEVDVLHSGQVAPEPTVAAIRSAMRANNRPLLPPRGDHESSDDDSADGGGESGGSGSGESNRTGEPVHSATFAEWMASLLDRQGLTREAAAAQLGVSVKTVGRWIGGETEPRLRDLRRIQAEFGELPFPAPRPGRASGH